MFSGIVAAVGRIAHVQPREVGFRLTIAAGALDLSDVALGDSIACNGVCLTVVERTATEFRVDVSQETLDCTVGLDAPGGGGKIPLLPDDYLVHLDEEGAVLRNYENKTFHYPQPAPGHRRELPMIGARSSHDSSPEELVACGDSYPDRDSYAAWGNSCGGDADDL